MRLGGENGLGFPRPWGPFTSGLYVGSENPFKKRDRPGVIRVTITPPTCVTETKESSDYLRTGLVEGKSGSGGVVDGTK